MAARNVSLRRYAALPFGCLQSADGAFADRALAELRAVHGEAGSLADLGSDDALRELVAFYVAYHHDLTAPEKYVGVAPPAARGSFAAKLAC